MKKFLSKIIFIDNIWGDKVSANNWLLPLSILIVALKGVILGVCIVFNTTNNTFGLEDYVPTTNNAILIATCSSLIILWGYNLAESIIASKTPLVALGRSVLTLVTIVAVFVLSCVASVVVLVIITLLLLALLILVVASKGLLGEGGKKFVLDNGDEVTKNDGLFGDGNYYSTTGSGKVYRSSDERTFREE